MPLDGLSDPRLAPRAWKPGWDVQEKDWQDIDRRQRRKGDQYSPVCLGFCISRKSGVAQVQGLQLYNKPSHVQTEGTQGGTPRSQCAAGMGTGLWPVWGKYSRTQPDLGPQQLACSHVPRRLPDICSTCCGPDSRCRLQSRCSGHLVRMGLGEGRAAPGLSRPGAVLRVMLPPF